MRNKQTSLAAILLAAILLAAGAQAPHAQEKDKPKPSKTADLAADFEGDFQDEEKADVADPLKYWNLAWFHFNDRLYFWALKPVAQGWDYVSPDFVQHRLDDFLTNLGFPARFLNTLLQARPHHSGIELVRFLTNTTVGIVGLWDPATVWMDLGRYDEDFDQTLGSYGIGMGCFLTWPLFGPSSLRGTIALPIDAYTKHPAPGSNAIDQINQTAMGENPYESLRKLAVDPYTSIRNAYVQNRRKAVKDRSRSNVKRTGARDNSEED